MKYYCNQHKLHYNESQGKCLLCERDLYKSELEYIKNIFEMTVNYNLSLSRSNMENHINRIKKLLK